MKVNASFPFSNGNYVEPARQVHLDFHTSELMPEVGSLFDRDQFRKALQTGHVGLINLFGKCHHSWCYYPTKVGRMHPQLKFDLLGAQMETCHETGVRAPVYITMGYSATDADEHPEWCQRELDGRYSSTGIDFRASPDDPLPDGAWKYLCPNTGYGDLVFAHAEEICRGYPIDGLWFDIYQAQIPCYCEACLRGMKDADIDPRDGEGALRFRCESFLGHFGKILELVKSCHPNASLFFNGTTRLNLQNVKHKVYRCNTKLDLEDLPTTWGGYDKLPLRARFFHRTGKQIVAMSGKFHTSWGEFGGFKHRDALRYEAACMIANGACANFGDQLHPDGHVDMTTYANIGHAFEYVEKIEEYGVPGRPVSDIALWFTASSEHDEGAAKMLLETQHEFEVVSPDDGCDLSRYRLIILPAATNLSAADAERIRSFNEAGGRVLALGTAALDDRSESMLLDAGADWRGNALYRNDYTLAHGKLSENLPASPFLNYLPAARFEPRPGAEVLADIYEPFFDRTCGAFCSHRNTPNRTVPALHPAAFRYGNILTLAHPLDAMYYRRGAHLHRRLFRNALRLLLPDPMLDVTMPSAGRATLLCQPHAKRHVVHLTYAAPMQRGDCAVIEDIVPLYDIPVTVRLPSPPSKAYAVPGPKKLQVTSPAGGGMHVVLPKLHCHAAIVLEE